MRILILNYEFPPLGGGAGNATYYLLKEFSKYKDLEIDLITSSTNGFKIKKFSKNITIHFLDINKKGNVHYQTNKDLLTYSYKAYKYSKQLLKNKEYDLCHAFFGIPCGYIALKLKKRYNLPYIVSLRGSDVPFYNKRFYWLDKIIFKSLSKNIWKNAQHTITNSECLKELAQKSSLNQKFSVIYNGVNIREFRPINNKKIKLPLKLISTGRLIQRKGYEYLIDALINLSDVELTLIGDGNLKEQLEVKAKDNNLKIKFLGKKTHNEISKLLPKADVFVLPSLNEGMSNSILEAMACGLPIITTDTGGSKELIKGNGFIVVKADSESLTKAITKFITHSNLIKSMGNTSRKLAENMSWEKVAREYLGVYR